MCHSQAPDVRRLRTFRGQAGFTLLELMIVMAIIAILAGIAYPRYRHALEDARVADGRAALMTLAGRLERCRTRTHSYDACVDLPSHSEARHYRLTATLLPTDYRLTATHEGEAVGTTCRVLTLDSTGRALPEACW
ncbi:type IV pilin protein [Halomonas sp. I1]|uniref:type IV pilin protein n=1 Tax=Halomonas sp. I1 TaxID=393536 RepID=UPI0028DED221|nr:type IV pilin protein [Halomonas sp. I1]MDT8894888.1 type IV pilin protein [Halomonas sp. I1]